METLQPVFQVSELVEMVNYHLELLNSIKVVGEISRIDIKNGRLIFITIKDKNSALDVFSLSHLIRDYHRLEVGMVVEVLGSVGLYKNSGKFRFFAQNLTIYQEEGTLEIAYQKLKAKLEAEGLFDPSHKRPLPEWPIKIGLVTAKDSSAYFDMIKILSTRMPGLTLKLIPVNVQGSQAIHTLTLAFKYINSHSKEFDLIIMGRGGGSLTDLMAFNEETIARAVFACKVPIISAVGHEDNWSLTDYVADLRASTPSNACEIAVKDKKALIWEIDSNLNLIHNLIKQKFQLESNHLNHSLQTIHKATLSITHQFSTHINKLNHISKKYILQINLNNQTITTQLKYIQNWTNTKLTLLQQQNTHQRQLLDSLNYQNILKRGFSITRNAAGQIITKNNQVKLGDQIISQLHQGSIKSTIN